jgi:hypothetical protein
MLNRRSILLAIAVLAVIFGWPQESTTAARPEYNPVINPADFVPQVTNRYFTLKPGAKFIYTNKTLRGTERIEVAVTKETKRVMGVIATVVQDRVWLNNRLIEDTRDWYAQDKAGNVWYFGEAVDNYRDGKLTDHKGSWEAGVKGAKPGIIMLANPKVGDTYRQEYYKGQAEDMGTIIALGKKVTVPYGTLEDCLQTMDSTPLETTSEYKYYCPEVGFMVLEESTRPSVPDSQRTELISIVTE